MIFYDRQDAGRQLASHLLKLSNSPNTIVLGLASGGLPIAFEVAQLLCLPFHTLIVRKIRAPQNANLALGAIAEQNVELLHADLIGIFDISKDYLKKEIENQKTHLAKQCLLYNTFARNLYQKHIVLVDDGMATGSSIQAALKTLKKHQVASIHLAIPVASHSSFAKITKEVQTTCLFSPSFFEKLADLYHVFDSISDQEMCDLISHLSHNLATAY